MGWDGLVDGALLVADARCLPAQAICTPLFKGHPVFVAPLGRRRRERRLLKTVQRGSATARYELLEDTEADGG